MISFIRKIFRNEEQEIRKIKDISLQQIEEWIEERSKPLMEEVKRQSDEILMKASEEAQRAAFNTEVLENAKLQNPNIPYKAKQYMEGNRKAYAKSISSFLGHLDINNRNYFYLLKFCKQFDELIKNLNNATLRSYTILQEFFANETNKIAQNIKNLDTIFKELKSALNNEKIASISNLRAKIEELKMKTKQKINLDVDFKSKEAEVNLAIGEKDAIMSDIEKFNNSGEHNNFLKLNEEKKNKEKNFYHDESRILQSFSVLERPLRKYSHTAFEHEEIILDYLNDPIEILANDKNLVIVDILKNMQKQLQENKLNVDEKKKEKSLDEIKKLSMEFIEQFLKKYFSHKKEIKEIEDKIKRTGAAEKMRDFSRSLKDANAGIEKSIEELNKMKNEEAKLENSISGLKREIESSVKDSFNEDVVIGHT